MPNDRASHVAGADGARWDHFAHGADIGVRGQGGDCAQAFAQAALALTAIVTPPATVRERVSFSVACEAPDREILLLDWLNALIVEMSTSGVLFARFEVSIAEPAGGRMLALQATAWGEAIDPERHDRAVEPKGATFTELRVGCDAAGLWTAQCVIDV